VTGELAAVLPAWGLGGARAARAPTGLIQETWFVDAPGRARVVVQRMHPIFGDAVLEDLDAITARLEAAGLETPRPVRTLGGALGVRDAAGQLWRALTYLEGETVDRVADPATAEAAGALVGRFHRALAGETYEFRFTRAGVHDTAGHLAKLARAGAGDALAEAILDEGARASYASFAALPRRVTHGDLKISNVLFRGGAAVALLDLDTLGRLPLPYELGDAWRSWCNPLGEDVEAARFDLDLFAAAARGYASAARGMIGRDEAAGLVAGVHAVAIELAARFCVDMFEDRYFGWDPRRFPSRREHNRVRAVGQLTLARQVAAARGEAEALVAALF
jgi:Ser/Thr protein kinase RdoA (MazF antagonist)